MGITWENEIDKSKSEDDFDEEKTSLSYFMALSNKVTLYTDWMIILINLPSMMSYNMHFMNYMKINLIMLEKLGCQIRSLIIIKRN